MGYKGYLNKIDGKNTFTPKKFIATEVVLSVINLPEPKKTYSLILNGRYGYHFTPEWQVNILYGLGFGDYNNLGITTQAGIGTGMFVTQNFELTFDILYNYFHGSDKSGTWPHEEKSRWVAHGMQIKTGCRVYVN
jgi:hypothetical protein